jgi:hypothetical protein
MDSEGIVEAAVALLLDKPDELVLWSQQGKIKKSKSSMATSNTAGTGKQGFGPRRGESQRGLASLFVRYHHQIYSFSR